jgi:hypothetical protein
MPLTPLEMMLKGTVRVDDADLVVGKAEYGGAWGPLPIISAGAA